MAFVDRLDALPIVLEVVPPHRRAGEKTIASLVQKVQDAASSVPHLDALNIPEVLDENHAGLPFYRNLGPRQFARRLREGVAAEAIVNKVVVHAKGEADLRAWLAAGNITIPERAGEVGRLVEKTRAGARFFTSQVLFEPEPISSVLREYGEACASAGVRPATVLLSFAPVADYEDIEFLAWLGATMTPETEEALLAHRGREVGRASFDVARRIWARIRDANAGSRHPVPLGVNVEEISVHNFDLAVRMAREFPSWKDAKATA